MLYVKKLDEADMAVPLLQILAVSIVTLATMRILAAALQGIGKMNLPVINLFIGALVKVVLTFVLVGIPSLNVNGAGISSVCAYLTAGILNYIALRKYADVRLNLGSVFVRPLIASLIMGAGAFGTYKLFFMLTSSNAVSTLLAIIIAVVIYFVAVFMTGALTREEVVLIPKGEMIYSIAKKCKIAR
jgi:stage V sporulation protein B